ncbi:MAG TPA: AmmeMemoRadiSam system protein B [Steroidobacteraceae bacterium]|nr:AmmeMemoRadiSam system protein B [Steroidobacteraceae bacterium]
MMRPSRSNTSVREPAVAGFFYPSDPGELRATVDDLLQGSTVSEPPTGAQTYIVPHAGYIYSGSVAATVYSALKKAAQPIRRVVLIGPSHRVYLRGIAVPQSDAFRTPLGDVPLDMERKRALIRRGDVIFSDTPHALEHSLEVQLPFLQRLSEGFELVPLVVGEATPEHIASVLDHIIDDADTLLLASSDLSHYLTYEEAREKDAETSSEILAFANNLVGEQACGAAALNGLLTFAKRRRAQITELARLNSGDTAGDRSRVVGYGAYAIYGDRRN